MLSRALESCGSAAFLLSETIYLLKSAEYSFMENRKWFVLANIEYYDFSEAYETKQASCKEACCFCGCSRNRHQHRTTLAGDTVTLPNRDPQQHSAKHNTDLFQDWTAKWATAVKGTKSSTCHIEALNLGICPGSAYGREEATKAKRNIIFLSYLADEVNTETSFCRKEKTSGVNHQFNVLGVQKDPTQVAIFWVTRAAGTV